MCDVEMWLREVKCADQGLHGRQLMDTPRRSDGEPFVALSCSTGWLCRHEHAPEL